jgi:DNA polymerase epsilon subunit 3
MICCRVNYKVRLSAVFHIYWVIVDFVNSGTVYRNNMKIDKAKKERAEKAAATASAKGKAKEVDPTANASVGSGSVSISIPATPKSKGKAPTSGSAPVSPTISTSISTAGAMLPPPFISAPRIGPMSVDAEPPSEPEPNPLPHIIGGDEMDIEDEIAENEDLEVDINVDEVDDDEAGEEAHDMMAVEEEEIRRDAKGLEEPIRDDLV